MFLHFIAKGFSNKETADKLNISIHTVNTHRKNIMEKTGIRSLAGLTVYAVSKGIISID
jgi:DNA-binding CsgD family transcriptional regulator